MIDKKPWNETIHDYPFNFNLVVDCMKTRVREDPNEGTKITVACPSNCSKSFEHHDAIEITLSDIEPTHIYGEGESVCGAARRNNILTGDGISLVDVTIVSDDIINPASDVLLESRQYFVVSTSSGEMRVQTIAGAPALLRGEYCGYNDSFPQRSKVF